MMKKTKINIMAYDYNDAGGIYNHHYYPDENNCVITLETMEQALFVKYEGGKIISITKLESGEYKSLYRIIE